jgi:rhodanese-related sulfurtransferase
MMAVTLIGFVAAGPIHGQARPSPASQALPAEKQTTLGLYVTAREAYERWRADSASIRILDVRTPEEFLFVGHAPMAWNIPFAYQTWTWDAAARHFPMRPNRDFVAQVRRVAGPGDTILVMCRSGGRSAAAVNQLAAAGFRNAYNITDGMEGDAVTDSASVFLGQRLRNGWKNSGVPWTYHVAPERMLLPTGQ